ncbi:MAG: DUF6994 family protein [Anaerorhabdus sp.]
MKIKDYTYNFIEIMLDTLCNNSKIEDIMDIVNYNFKNINSDIKKAFPNKSTGRLSLGRDRDRISPVLNHYKHTFSMLRGSKINYSDRILVIDKLKYSGDTMNNITIISNVYKSDTLNELKDLNSVIYTIGNFIPVPIITNGGKIKSFNQHRGTWSKTKDYWDLTMKWIHEYYFTKECNDIFLNANALWFDQFNKNEEGWKKFVDYHFLNDYVDKDYNLILLWSASAKDRNVEDEEDLIEFKRFCKLSRLCIINRSLRIIKHLKTENEHIKKLCEAEIKKNNNEIKLIKNPINGIK